ncbi:PH domain-containing protein [Pseudonocardia nematodicida]|uniref:PH domain-containing protein n=1 Tax=Pseudonocardia nematodicida TaxID=1206997 RepID=A0ABV1K5P4_9PSEU
MSSTDDRETAAPAPDPSESPVPTPVPDLGSTPVVRDEGRKVRDGNRRLVFKHSRLTIFAALVATVGATPLIFSLPWFWLILVVPVAVIAFVLRVRTTVDPDTVAVRSATGSRSLAWNDVQGLKLGKRSSVSAVLADDSEVALPAVHVRDLPALAAASGGRFADPVADAG